MVTNPFDDDRFVEIQDVGPRDGLQNEAVEVTTADKIRFVNGCVEAGITRIEVASFVNPKRVPRMADGDAVIAGLPPADGVIYSGLVLNEKGLERAKGKAIQEIGVVAVSSDGFGIANQKQTSAESVEMVCRVINGAHEAGLRTVAVISTAFGCPYEGVVPQSRVIEIVRRLADAQPTEITLADTIGAAVPTQVRDLVGAAQEVAPRMPLRCHFHNTRNTGLANIYAALEVGVRRFDSSLGGIGGCPFAPKATGNVATEDVVHMVEACGYRTGLDLAKLIEHSHWLDGVLGRPTPALVSKAGIFPPADTARGG
ncbi:MAG: hydroxymethylglutaryl-CoA lyase [Alphaproteobacteria bacterium]